MKRRLFVLVWFSVLFFSVPVLAQDPVPLLINYQGSLKAVDGPAYTGTIDINFTIYDDSLKTNPSLYSESHTGIVVTKGLFNLLIGSGTIDTTPPHFDNLFDLFTGEDRYLEIQIDSNPAMPTLQRIVSVAHSIRAASAANGVPSGAVMFFNLGSCPGGWSELDGNGVPDARGRVVVGLPASGTLAGTVGSALSNLGTRTITDLPAHTHSINPPSTGSSSAGNHTHSGAGTGNAGGHNHDLQYKLGGGGSGVQNQFEKWGDDGGSGWGTFNPNGTRITSSGSHAHSVTVNSAGSHAHTTDIGSFTSGSTGSGSVDVTAPYIQFLTCQKD